jgi:hypothetical protein
MHMYRQVKLNFRSMLLTETCVLSSLVTGSRSHKLVTSDVSRILWYYYNDSVRTLSTSPSPPTDMELRSGLFL